MCLCAADVLLKALCGYDRWHPVKLINMILVFNKRTFASIWWLLYVTLEGQIITFIGCVDVLIHFGMKTFKYKKSNLIFSATVQKYFPLKSHVIYLIIFLHPLHNSSSPFPKILPLFDGIQASCCVPPSASYLWHSWDCL